MLLVVSTWHHRPYIWIWLLLYIDHVLVPWRPTCGRRSESNTKSNWQLHTCDFKKNIYFFVTSIVIYRLNYNIIIPAYWPVLFELCVFGTLIGEVGLQPPCAEEYLSTGISTTSTATGAFIAIARGCAMLTSKSAKKNEHTHIYIYIYAMQDVA